MKLYICSKIGQGNKDGWSITFFKGNKHEHSLAGELVQVLWESRMDVMLLLSKFLIMVKRKMHGMYGAFFKEDIDRSTMPKRIVFDN